MNKPLKLLIYGCGADYLRRKQLLSFEIIKGNVVCDAVVSKDRFADYVDGMTLLHPYEARVAEFDYVLVFSDTQFDGICKELIDIGVARERILDSRILCIPDFDFNRYHSLLRDPVTIVSCDCLAAQIYSYLMLCFSSPFILLKTINNDEYFRLLHSFEYYMEQEFREEKSTDLENAEWGIASLGYGSDRVRLELFHYPSFQSAKECWDKRKKRINNNRVLFTGYVLTPQEEESVRQLTGRRKCFFSSNREYAQGGDIYYLPRFRWRIEHQCDVFGYGLWDYVRNMEQLSHSIDILKMLCGETDFINESLR